ncbi:hypothetical protein [Evansella clarkii]|uniref:hypothetical protein n=1 Tax=Evansella clarkii TaxID=79879 RepID=UPI0009979E50|nr:hypothetical protein [Evansella clarkii]
MSCIKTQSYVKVERFVNSIEQTNVEKEKTMELYEDKIVTALDEFKLKTVFDISYRTIKGEEGWLYLHTTKGVFPYIVKTDPYPFIEAFREVQKTAAEEE